MFLQEPNHSPYDLNFVLFGFPIRIAWTFWLGAAIFGYGLADGIDRSFGAQSPGLFPLLFLWAACLFVSILIHELGHAFAFRFYGQECSVVLYHFGGLAIPNSSSDGLGFARSLRPRHMTEQAELWIALAGPVAQMLSAAVLVVGVVAMGFEVIAFRLMPWPLSDLMPWVEGRRIESVGLNALILFYVLPSVLWALLNLLPVFPLDGGRVMRSLMMLSGDRGDTWLWISMGTAALAGFYGFNNGQPFMGLLFLSLAFGNYQMMQTPYR